MRWVVVIILVLVLSLTGCDDLSTFGDDVDNMVDNFKNRGNETQPIIQKEIKSLFIGHLYSEDFNTGNVENKNLKKGYLDLLNEYDVLALQGINDYTQKSLGILTQDTIYDYKISTQTNNHQYGFIFSPNVQFLDAYTEYGNFKYPPFIGHIKAKNKDFNFFVVQIHIDKLDATNEINELNNIVENIIIEYNNTNIIVLGNMYADCVYYDDEENDDFIWLIRYSDDTTIGNNNCAYDRIFVTDDMNTKVLAGGIFNHHRELGFNDDLVEAMSERYPSYAVINVE